MSFLHSLSRVKTERVSGMNTSDRIRNAAYAAMFAALLAVCSWITVPGTVPFTMQTFGVFCALLLLGGKLGENLHEVELSRDLQPRFLR